jgi:ABC-2 type transport system permease protein
MRGMMMVARRDLAAYLNNVWGYAVIAAVLVVDGILFNAVALGDRPKYSAEVMEQFFEFSFATTIIASILLTMRLVAEERQTGTLVLVDSSPLRPWQIIGGKYVSAMTVLSGLILVTLYMPALVFVNGKVSYGHIVAGYTGLLLVAAATAAIGTFASTVSRSQLVAGFASTALTVVLVISWLLAKVSDPPLKDVFSYMSLYDRHFRGFMQGQINTEDIVFYVSIAFVSVTLSTRFMAARRWR